jgi:hypothetical protein
MNGGRIGQFAQAGSSRLPKKPTLEYLKLTLEVLLLLLAVPLIIWHIHHNPGQAAEKAWARGG